MKLENVFWNDSEYRMPQALENAPYRHLCVSVWMDGLKPCPMTEYGPCIETRPDGKGSLVFCVEHADVAILDSGICYASVYRTLEPEPVWSTPLDRAHGDIVLMSGNETCHIRIQTPVMDWQPGEYFLLLTNIDPDYVYVREVDGCSVVPFSIERYTPNYRPSRTWNSLRTETVTCDDGTYEIPVCQKSAPAPVMTLFVNGQTGPVLRMKGNTRQSVRIRIGLDEVTEEQEVLIGLYRKGETQPLWTVRERLEPNQTDIDLNTWVLDLTPGKYFVLLGMVGKSSSSIVPIQRIGTCWRRDFIVSDCD